MQKEFDLFLEAELPPAIRNFPIWWLAKFWHTTTEHVCNLVKTGALECPVDLRTAGSSRATVRIPRPFVIKFINARRDTGAVADANPRPLYREESKRKSKAS